MLSLVYEVGPESMFLDNESSLNQISHFVILFTLVSYTSKNLF